jgi:hypothetical protein
MGCGWVRQAANRHRVEGVVLGWREEVDVVLREWIAIEGGDRDGRRWQRVGRARPGSEPGQFVVDIRSVKLTADQADDLCLAGPDKQSIPGGFRVMDAGFEGEVLRLRVAEHANPPDAYLWWQKQEPAFLLKKLREGIAGLADAGLAALLVQGKPGGTLSAAAAPRWLQDGQEHAYRACLGKGLFLVWGPPGTGKTRVLRSAIGDLLAAGKRVLLVSGTNIAVDNALHETLKERTFASGEVVRVGPPHLKEIADNPDVSLPLMVRTKLAQVEADRRAAAEELRAMNARRERLESLNTQLAGFDAAAYEDAAALLAVPGESVAELTATLAGCEEAANRVVPELESARSALDAALTEVAKARPVLAYWKETDRLTAELTEVEQDATQAEARALRAKTAADKAQDDADALERPNGKVRWGNRRAHDEARQLLDKKRRAFEEERAAAIDARRIAAASRRDTEREIARLAAAAPLSREEIQRRDNDAALARARLRALEQAQRALLTDRTRLAAGLASARAAAELVADCDRRGLPALHTDAGKLRGATARDSASRRSVEARYDELQKQYERMEKGARGEIIAAARLVATTLARFRIVKAVFDGPYDVVLIDEAGAASLPEVLLAVAKAGTCAVLLGDFMQLGPVLPSELEGSDRWDVKKWLITDAFRHCGISTLDEARSHPSCLVLDTQHRFGPDVMHLANRIAYDGLLKAGPAVRPHAVDDPEIVLIDTDGLGELAEVRRDSGVAGWWPAGLLLSRSIAEMHRNNGEDTGVVTPYTLQAAATLEALRDVESLDAPLADVGTAHRFQGREFPVVVFDTVESQFGAPGWIAQATLAGGSNWKRDGVRLFNVAVTRVKHRLYVIASRERVLTAPSGTAFSHLGAMLQAGRVRWAPAKNLIRPPTWEPLSLGPESTALAEVLARHIEVTDIDDEKTFYAQLTRLIDDAKHSIWLWSPWIANRVYQLLPRLETAVSRGVTITVFTRDPGDQTQGTENSAKAVKALRGIGARIVEVNIAHQKVVVIDDHTVMLGSLNPLSQHRTRELMITTRGAHFARRLLTDLHAEEFAAVPRCRACGGDQVDLRRGAKGFYWRCYSKTCPDVGKGSSSAWTQPVVLKQSR